MFGKDFYPTPDAVTEAMMYGEDVKGKNILEPSAGKGNIVKWLKSHGANVIACEINADLRKVVQSPNDRSRFKGCV